MATHVPDWLMGHDYRKCVSSRFSYNVGQSDPIVMTLKLDMSCHLLSVYIKF